MEDLLMIQTIINNLKQSQSKRWNIVKSVADVINAKDLQNNQDICGITKTSNFAVVINHHLQYTYGYLEI